MRYRLRTLLIAATVGPPLLAGAWFGGVWLLGDIWLVLAAMAMLAVALVLVVGMIAMTAMGEWIVDTSVDLVERKNRR